MPSGSSASWAFRARLDARPARHARLSRVRV